MTTDERKALYAEYNRIFALACAQYGWTDAWPLIVEKMITNDMQLLEQLEAIRLKVREDLQCE